MDATAVPDWAASIAGTSSTGGLPSAEVWFDQLAAVFASRLDAVARAAVPADIAHLLPAPLAAAPSASAALSASQTAAATQEGLAATLQHTTLAKDPYATSTPSLGCLSSSYISRLKQKQPELLGQVRALSPAGAVHFLLSNLSPASSAADTGNIQRLPFLEDTFDSSTNAYPLLPANPTQALSLQHPLRLIPILNSKGLGSVLPSGQLSLSIKRGLPEALAAALLRAIYRSSLPTQDYYPLLSDPMLVQKCCAFLRGEFDSVNIIDILVSVASITKASIYGPGEASQVLASLSSSLPIALDQSSAIFVCRAFDLYLFFLTGKEEQFSNFHRVEGRHLLAALIDTPAKELRESRLDATGFVRVQLALRDVLQNVQRSARKGLTDYLDVHLANLMRLEVFVDRFLDDAKGNYTDNQQFLHSSLLYRRIAVANIPLLVLNSAESASQAAHAGGVPSSSPRKAPKSRRRDECDQALPYVSGKDLSALDARAWGQNDDLPLPSSPKKPKVPQDQPAADISSEEESDESDDSSSSD